MTRKSIDLEDIIPSERSCLTRHTCQICRRLVQSAYNCSCLHLFCKECILPLYSTAPVCPITREAISQPQPVEYIDQVIKETSVFCTNRQLFCSWEGKSSTLTFHLDSDCPKENICCLHDRCESIVMRENLLYHTENCAFRKVNCEYCEDKVAFIDRAVHYEVCVCYPIECTNGCGEYIQRRALDTHKRDACPNTLLDCPFKTLGCRTTLLRFQMAEHLDKSVSDHLITILHNNVKKDDIIQSHISLESRIREIESNIHNSISASITNAVSAKLDEAFSTLVSRLPTQSTSGKGGLLGKKRQREDDELTSDLENTSSCSNIATSARKKTPSFCTMLKDDATKVSINGRTAKYTSSQEDHCYLLHKSKTSTKGVEWIVYINSDPKWIAMGLCHQDKAKQFSVNNHHSYLITSNGYSYNCSEESENNKSIDCFEELKKGDTIQFRYLPSEGLLLYRINESTLVRQLKKIPKVKDISPCVVLHFKNDEITVDY
jgi:hypothetical protein